MENHKIIQLEKIAKKIRRQCLDLAFEKNPKSTHLGGALSSVDILTSLYFSIMRYDYKNPELYSRDRFILSKGHSILGYYSILHEAKFFTKEILYSYSENDTDLPGHPVRNKKLGIEFTNGSLGMGIGVGIGHALAAKKKNLDFKTFVLMGDGECNEGSVWEAALMAPHYNLNNLYIIIDRNNFQQTGKGSDIINVPNIEERFKSFGWYTTVIDGHNINEICNALNFKSLDKPIAVIANTTKGKGFTFTENNNSWHHAMMTAELYNIGLHELGQKDD
jgi:transketolase